MVRLTLYSIYLTFKCQTIAVVLVGPMAVAGMVLWYDVGSRCFLGIGSLDFFECQHGMVCETGTRSLMSQSFWKNVFSPKMGEMILKGSFFNLKKNLITVFVWFSVFLHKPCIWGKSCSWDIGQNNLSQSDSRIFKLTITLEQIDETASFFCRLIQNFLLEEDQNMGVTSLVPGL